MKDASTIDMPEPEFRVGDTVMPRRGGQAMEVFAVNVDGSVRCQYRSKERKPSRLGSGRLVRATFQPEELIKLAGPM